MAEQRTNGRRLQFGLKMFFAIATVSPILVGLFWPRVGPPLSGCHERGKESVWIAPPSRAEVFARCKTDYPDIVLPTNAPIVTDKVFEEVVPCNFLNFQGRRYLHRVRYRSEVYLTKTYPSETVAVLIDYDHYHLNGGGGESQTANEELHANDH